MKKSNKAIKLLEYLTGKKVELKESFFSDTAFRENLVKELKDELGFINLFGKHVIYLAGLTNYASDEFEKEECFGEYACEKYNLGSYKPGSAPKEYGVALSNITWEGYITESEPRAMDFVKDVEKWDAVIQKKLDEFDPKFAELLRQTSVKLASQYLRFFKNDNIQESKKALNELDYSEHKDPDVGYEIYLSLTDCIVRLEQVYKDASFEFVESDDEVIAKLNEIHQSINELRMLFKM